MIFAELEYAEDYWDIHDELVELIESRFENVQHGHQSDSWIWVFENNEDNLLRIATGEKEIITRRQELPPAYIRDGAIYITKTSVLKEQNSLYGNSLAYIKSDAAFHVNLDTLQDWAEAEKMVLQYNTLK